MSSQSSHHPQEVLLAQFSLYVHKGGLKPDSFHLSDTVCRISDVLKLIMVDGQPFKQVKVHTSTPPKGCMCVI